MSLPSFLQRSPNLKALDLIKCPKRYKFTANHPTKITYSTYSFLQRCCNQNSC